MQEPYSRRTSEGPSSFLTYHAWLTCYFCLDFQTPGIRTYCFGRSQGIFQFSSHNCNVLITTFVFCFYPFSWKHFLSLWWFFHRRSVSRRTTSICLSFPPTASSFPFFSFHLTVSSPCPPLRQQCREIWNSETTAKLTSNCLQDPLETGDPSGLSSSCPITRGSSQPSSHVAPMFLLVSSVC